LDNVKDNKVVQVESKFIKKTKIDIEFIGDVLSIHEHDFHQNEDEMLAINERHDYHRDLEYRSHVSWYTIH